METLLKDKIAGFDSSLVKNVLKSHFKYCGKIDRLKIDADDEVVVRLYNEEMDVRVVKKEYFRLKSIIVQNYTRQKREYIIEVTDRVNQLCMVGWMGKNG